MFVTGSEEGRLVTIMELNELRRTIALWWRFGRRCNTVPLTDISGAFRDDTPKYISQTRLNVYDCKLHMRGCFFDMWINQKQLNFPSICCVCGDPASTTRDVPAAYVLPTSCEIRAVPHCADCIKLRRVPFIAICVPLCGTVETSVIVLYSRSKQFLTDVISLNRSGDVFPPWIAFPDSNPISNLWGQGNSEYWMYNVWTPFLATMPEPECMAYFDRWNAPEEWREWVTAAWKQKPVASDGNPTNGV
jgi:hypothetical protein